MQRYSAPSFFFPERPLWQCPFPLGEGWQPSGLRCCPCVPALRCCTSDTGPACSETRLVAPQLRARTVPALSTAPCPHRVGEPGSPPHRIRKRGFQCIPGNGTWGLFPVKVFTCLEAFWPKSKQWCAVLGALRWRQAERSRGNLKPNRERWAFRYFLLIQVNYANLVIVKAISRKDAYFFEEWLPKLEFPSEERDGACDSESWGRGTTNCCAGRERGALPERQEHLWAMTQCHVVSWSA